MNNVTASFLEKIHGLSQKKIPEKVMDRAKQSLVDYIAVTSAGAEFQKEKLNKYIEFAHPEEGEFTAIGMNQKLALKEAVFLNGLNGHALDFDDGTNSGIIHLGSPVFSLLLPLAQRYDCSLEKLLWAAVLGYETSYTMAVSIQPGHKALGYHATGTCGVLGAVIAASYMLDFTQEERKNAFATACVSATGMLKVLDDGSELKPYNVAKTALLALVSIQMAKAGFVGHPDSLGGSRGYFKMMTGREDIELKPLLLNGTYAIMKSYTKPYASCRYTHPSIEAAINIRNEYGLSAEEIAEITVNTYSLAVGGHDHTNVPGSASAKMSIPYSVAVALIYGKAGLLEFDDEHVKNTEILTVTKKVKVFADEEISRVFPAMQSAVLWIRTKEGNIYTNRVDYPKGEPENPLSDQEFKDRYSDLLRYAEKTEFTIDTIYSAVMKQDSDIRTLMELV